MDIVSKQIRNALNYIKKTNIKFIDSDKKINEEKTKELEKKIQELNEKEKDYKNDLFGPDHEINEVINHKLDENTNLLQNEKENLSNRKNMNKNIEKLINSLNENKVIQAKEYAEKLKEQKIMLAR